MEKLIGCYEIHLDKKFNKEREDLIYDCINTDTKIKCFARILNKRDQNINCQTFNQERKVLEQLKWLRHDNLLIIYDYKEEVDSIYQFYELYDETLVEYMKPENFITKFQFFDFISQISSGYMELKKLNIIHRDLKPESIIIKKHQNDIKYKIADFRMSRIIDNQENLHTKVLVNTKYCSPETLLNNMKSSYESDIFSFGIILYEMIEGNLEITENQKKQKEFFEAIRIKGFKEYFKERENQNNLPEGILPILDNLIAYDPSKRITWENLNSLVTQQLREYYSYQQPISGRAEINLNHKMSVGNSSNLNQMVENTNFQNQNTTKQKKNDNNQFFNNQKTQLKFDRFHLRTESDMNIQEIVNLQKNQNNYNQNLFQPKNNLQNNRINFNTLK
ncbi:unnamed protein product [Paramecium primaurelia]|uniref:Protein kinase domain-containing protein n=1 Tax=Paramecium primaurelia TaxID=5886 RepID=A0A8S1P7Q6_PARPR|nr:unnamed protein product [Paramecium primaurelia]